jgi:hypothetical protein
MASCVAAARGCAAPPPMIERGGCAVGLACASGDGDAAGELAGAADFAAGVGGAGALVQAASSAMLTRVVTMNLCLGPGDTRKLLLTRDDTDHRANQPASHDIRRVVQARIDSADAQAERTQRHQPAGCGHRG